MKDHDLLKEVEAAKDRIKSKLDAQKAAVKKNYGPGTLLIPRKWA